MSFFDSITKKLYLNYVEANFHFINLKDLPKNFSFEGTNFTHLLVDENEAIEHYFLLEDIFKKQIFETHKFDLKKLSDFKVGTYVFISNDHYDNNGFCTTKHNQSTDKMIFQNFFS